MFHLLILVSTVIINFILGTIVFLKNSKNRANQFFALFTICIVFWTIFNFLADNPTQRVNALLWNRLTLSVINFIAASAILSFALHFPKKMESLKNLNTPIWIVSSFGFLLGSFSPFLIADVKFYSYGTIPVYGSLYLVSQIWSAILVLLLIYIFVHQYRTAKRGVEREQLKYLFLGILVFGIFATITGAIIPLISHGYESLKLMPYGTISLISTIAYSIVRHRFLDIRLAIRAGLVRVILILVLAGAFVGLVEALRLIFGEMDWKKGVISAFVFGLFVAAFYEPILRSIRAITDRVLFQREYSYQELLKNLGKMIAESLDLEELLSNIRQTLLEVMQVSYVGFVLVREGEEDHPGIEARGFENLKEYSWKKDNLVIEQLRANPKILVYDELKKEISEKPEGLVHRRLERVADEMSKIGAAVVVPLPSSEGIVGMIALGEKKGRDAFTSSDIATLETLMYQAGIAIENASLFTKVQDFNRTLRQRIAEATTDLSAKNKRLSILRRLDEIIINTPDLSEMIQKVVDVISWEMGYLGGVLFILNEEGRLQAKAYSQTPLFRRAIKSSSISLSKISFGLSIDPSNLLSRAVKERGPFDSDDLADFFVPGTSNAAAKKFQKESGLQHFVGFSLSSKGKPLGALLFALHTSYKNLSADEEELLQAFVDQAGIALENAKLYSDLKNANLELRHSYARLKELDKMKDELVSISSHELRTPMTSIKSYLWMALNKANNLTPKLKRYLERAYQSSDRMIKLVEEMLSVSRLDSGRLQLLVKKLDLPKIISSVISELSTSAQEKKIEIAFEKPKKELPNVLADEEKIREVLINLIDNALKFTPEKGKICISCRRRGKMVEIAVADTGVGIAKEDLPKLFQKFGRLEHSFATMAESAGGTGLGLYIAKNIIDLHRGKIWVRSQKGKGCKFTFSLRVAE